MACLAAASALATRSLMTCCFSSRSGGWLVAIELRFIFFCGVAGGVTRLAIADFFCRLAAVARRCVTRISFLLTVFRWRVGVSTRPLLIVIGCMTLRGGLQSTTGTALTTGSFLMTVFSDSTSTRLVRPRLDNECSIFVWCSSCLIDWNDLPQKHFELNLAILESKATINNAKVRLWKVGVERNECWTYRASRLWPCLAWYLTPLMFLYRFLQPFTLHPYGFSLSADLCETML